MHNHSLTTAERRAERARDAAHHAHTCRVLLECSGFAQVFPGKQCCHMHVITFRDARGLYKQTVQGKQCNMPKIVENK